MSTRMFADQMKCPECENTSTLQLWDNNTIVWCPECDCIFSVSEATLVGALSQMKTYQVIISGPDGRHVYYETDDYDKAKEKLHEWLGPVYDQVGPDTYISEFGSKITIERRKSDVR